MMKKLKIVKNVVHTVTNAMVNNALSVSLEQPCLMDSVNYHVQKMCLIVPNVQNLITKCVNHVTTISPSTVLNKLVLVQTTCS